MSKYIDVDSLEGFRDFILYGEVHKVPLSLLRDDLTIHEVNDFDQEQMAKVSIAATINWLLSQGYKLTKS